MCVKAIHDNGDGNAAVYETKYFFAHDKLIYARMLPLYLSDMETVKVECPDIYSEFINGNWVVNKNKDVPFCCIGADHALEHVNRQMKVAGGLVGITLHPQARLRFFLTQPEMSQLSEDVQRLVGHEQTNKGHPHHHQLNPAVITRHDRSVKLVLQTMEQYTNPFTVESDDLCHLATNAVVPDDVKDDLCNHSKIGQDLMDTFISERLVDKRIHFWSPMKKCRMKTWKYVAKKVKHRIENTVVELREDRNLFARMVLVVSKRADMNLQEVIGAHEMSVVPRSMFAADGSMLKTQNKSDLMSILESLIPKDTAPELCAEDTPRASDIDINNNAEMNVVVVDSMEEVQCIHKGSDVVTCKDLANQFAANLLSKYKYYDEIHFVFDRYDLPLSLKEQTRVHRVGSDLQVAYKIEDATNIRHVPMKRLLFN